MQKLSFKSGSSFKAAFGYTPTPGLAPDTLAGVTITSEIRTKEGTLIATLVSVTTSDTGFQLSAADTSGWPNGVEVEWDVKMSHATYGIFYTETVLLSLDRRVTA